MASTSTSQHLPDIYQSKWDDPARLPRAFHIHQRALVIADHHRPTAQNIRRTYQHRIPNCLAISSPPHNSSPYHLEAAIPKSSMSAPKRFRSSARSILSGEVPKIHPLHAPVEPPAQRCRPPNWTIPLCLRLNHAHHILKRQRSKYSRSAVS